MAAICAKRKQRKDQELSRDLKIKNQMEDVKNRDTSCVHFRNECLVFGAPDVVVFFTVLMVNSC